MDQDIHFQHKTAFASGAITTYFGPLPYDCTLRNVTGVVQADPGENETITFTGGGSVASGAAGATTALGVLTFGSGIAAGALGTWAANATTGGMTLLAGSLMKLVTSAAAAADVDLDIELDPYAR
jgi:hypothetical protein